MANSPQARKRARQNDKRRAHNASLRSLVRTKIKQVIAAADTGNADDARAAYDSRLKTLAEILSKMPLTLAIAFSLPDTIRVSSPLFARAAAPDIGQSK